MNGLYPYEILVIIDPRPTDEEVAALLTRLGENLKSLGAEVGKVESCGKRRLAYAVRKFHDGLYILMTFEGGGAVIHELERRLRVTEPVIKFLTVRIDEEQKRLDKIKALRDARKKVSAQPAAPAEAAAAPAAETPATA